MILNKYKLCLSLIKFKTFSKKSLLYFNKLLYFSWILKYLSPTYLLEIWWYIFIKWFLHFSDPIFESKKSKISFKLIFKKSVFIKSRVSIVFCVNTLKFSLDISLIYILILLESFIDSVLWYSFSNLINFSLIFLEIFIFLSIDEVEKYNEINPFSSSEIYLLINDFLLLNPKSPPFKLGFFKLFFLILAFFELFFFNWISFKLWVFIFLTILLYIEFFFYLQ